MLHHSELSKFSCSIEQFSTYLNPLSQAVRRRFDKRIYIPLPDLKARQHMFKVQNCPIQFQENCHVLLLQSLAEGKPLIYPGPSRGYTTQLK